MKTIDAKNGKSFISCRLESVVIYFLLKILKILTVRSEGTFVKSDFTVNGTIL